jgi:hypothetical protein
VLQYILIQMLLLIYLIDECLSIMNLCAVPPFLELVISHSF